MVHKSWSEGAWLTRLLLLMFGPIERKVSAQNQLKLSPLHLAPSLHKDALYPLSKRAKRQHSVYPLPETERSPTVCYIPAIPPLKPRSNAGHDCWVVGNSTSRTSSDYLSRMLLRSESCRSTRKRCPNKRSIDCLAEIILQWQNSVTVISEQLVNVVLPQLPMALLITSCLCRVVSKYSAPDAHLRYVL